MINNNMIIIFKLKNILKEFAEKYNFIQEIDILMVETSDFNRQKYLQIDNKPFISINEYKNKIEIVFGKINIEIDTIDEEEMYYIEKNDYFVINPLEYENENILIETITRECKNHKLI
jgi:hypothetical protein